MPALTRHSIEATGDRSARDDDYRRYLALWQAGIVRQIGPVGWPIAVLGTIAGMLALLRVARPLASSLLKGVGGIG